MRWTLSALAITTASAALLGCSDRGSGGSPAAANVAPATSTSPSTSGLFGGASAPLGGGTSPAGAPAVVQCPGHPQSVGWTASQTITTSVDPICYRLGQLLLHWRPGGPTGAVSLVVSHASDPQHAIWASRPGRGFVVAAKGDAAIQGSNTAGFFKVQDALRWQTSIQRVDAVAIAGGAVEVRGELLGGRLPVPYVASFVAKGARQLGFSIDVQGGANRVRLWGASHPKERFLGFGEQFNHVDHKGLLVPILVREQGIGRGKQPLTAILNAAQGVGGDWSHTYAPMPLTITDDRRGLVLEDSEYSEFDLTEPTRFDVSLFASRMIGRIVSGATLLDLITESTEVTGRMQPLPDWMHEGAIIGMTGGEQAVLDMDATLRRHDVPVSGWFLQDWVGERSTLFGTRLWWNWEPDPATYPDWNGLVQRLRGQGDHVFSYVNPFLVDANAKGSFQRNLYAEALTQGFLVQDASGQVRAFDQGGYSAGLVDLSNPAAFAWLKDVIKQQVLSTGVSGWMGDFGEALPLDANLYAGDAAVFHNRYPEEWQRLQREAVAEAGLTGQIVFFSRSGFTRSPGQTRLFWAGDQLTTWDEHDGLKSSIVGLMSSGISGMSLNHTDIGGYTTIGLGPLVVIKRSKELFLRWMEVNAFTPVYRTHLGLHPNAGHRLDSDAETLDHFARMTKVFKALQPYRKQLMQEAATKGWPLVRHPFLHDPDPALLRQRYAFQLGSEYLIAPVTDPGKRSVEVTLPRGRWVSLWTAQVYGDPAGTQQVTLPAPIGWPPVLYREGSAEGSRLATELTRQGIR